LIDSVLSDSDISSIVSYAQSQYGLRTSWDHFFGVTGDSLTEGQDDNEFNYGENVGRLMGDYLGPSWKCCNAGVAGLSTPAMNTKAAYGLDRQVVGVAGRKICVFLGGTNDLGVESQSAATLQTRVTSFITNRSNAGFSEIYVGTVVKRDDTNWSASKETERQTYNAWVRAQSGSLFTGVVDLDAQSAFSNASDTTYYVSDKLHWKQAARNVAVSTIKTAIGV
jgi:lysophospholipase L1-like esterase